MWVLNRQGWLHYGKCKEPVDFGATPAQETNCHLTGDYHPTSAAHNQDHVGQSKAEFGSTVMPLTCLFYILCASQGAHKEITDHKHKRFSRLQIDLFLMNND